MIFGKLIFNISGSFQADNLDHFLRKLRPYGQPGQLPIGNFGCLIDWVKSSNFISWLLYNQCTCTQLVKRSIRVVKVIICYIDSDPKMIYFEY